MRDNSPGHIKPLLSLKPELLRVLYEALQSHVMRMDASVAREMNWQTTANEASQPSKKSRICAMTLFPEASIACAEQSIRSGV